MKYTLLLLAFLLTTGLSAQVDYSVEGNVLKETREIDSVRTVIILTTYPSDSSIQ